MVSYNNFFGGLLGGLLGEIFEKLFGGSFGPKFIGIFIGIITSTSPIKIVDSLEWSITSARNEFIFSFSKLLIIYLITVLGIFIYSTLNLNLSIGLIITTGITIGLIYGSFISLGYTLISSLFYGLQSSTLPSRYKLNQGIMRSFKNALIVGLIFSLIFGISLGLLRYIAIEFSNGLFIGFFTEFTRRTESPIFIGLFGGVISFIKYGGYGVFKHYHLRLFLAFTTPAPSILSLGLRKLVNVVSLCV